MLESLESSVRTVQQLTPLMDLVVRIDNSGSDAEPKLESMVVESEVGDITNALSNFFRASSRLLGSESIKLSQTASPKRRTLVLSSVSKGEQLRRGNKKI